MSRITQLMTGTLRFVESNDGYSTYVNRWNSPVYLAHGSRAVLLPLSEVDLDEVWSRISTLTYDRIGTFRDTLRDMVINPDDVEFDVTFCDSCASPERIDETTDVANGWTVCQSCLYNDYRCCDMCEEFHRDYMSTYLDYHDKAVCDRCRDNYYTYCDYCEDYRRDEDEDHYHEDEDPGCCESPEQSFVIRNDGEGTLANDTRVTVTLPAGELSDEGIGAIANLLRNEAYAIGGDYDDTTGDYYKLHQLAVLVPELGNKWQTKEGNYTKRLSKLAYKRLEFKLSADIVSRVGSIASDHSRAVDVHVETTRDLNQSAAKFAHVDSCWWQSYYQSRCALKTNGGFGLRSFGDYGVTGRAWIIPLRLTEDGNLVPTFETESPSAFIVFNGYGNLSGYAPARIMSHMAGMTYRKVSFDPGGDGSGDCGGMYVNNGSGYLVAPEDIADNYTDGSLALYLSAHSDLHNTERVSA